MSNQSERLQSAMEYLMTYGWAILIIAVVLGALFQLGIFNASTFTPKAPPGACHVFRPNGPMTSSFINLQGICNGELPQYAAKFNGASSEISILSGLPTGNPQYTVSIWFSTPFIPSTPYLGLALVSWGTDGVLDEINAFRLTAISECANGGFYNYWWANDLKACLSSKLSTNTWHFAVASFNGNTRSIYMDGSLITSDSPTGHNIVGSSGYIGVTAPTLFPDYFNGELANVQIYNTSLSANELNALYSEGIGGAPIKLNNLVGWWPLNGDAKDYSGNNNNGVPTGISFTSSWAQGYSAP